MFLLQFLCKITLWLSDQFLSQIQTDVLVTNHSQKYSSRCKLINPIGRISKRVLRASWKAMTRTILRNGGALSGYRQEEREYWENTWTKRKGRQKGDAWWRRRANEAREGEGDATRLINRHADNHSGFMVTTDYQVVQGGIFHIRDVTLFQWGNTCSARYKLHERAYTTRHVCCMSALVDTRMYMYITACSHITKLAREGVQVLRSSRSIFAHPPFTAPVSKLFPRSATIKMPGHFSKRAISWPITGDIVHRLDIRSRD